MGDNTTKIRVVIDSKSFSSYNKISSELQQLQKDLNALLTAHPLKIKVQAELTGVKTKLSELKEELSSINNVSNIQITFQNQDVMSQLNAIESKMREIHNFKDLDVRINYENIEKAAQQVSTELKTAFSKIGGTDALQSLDQMSKRLEAIPVRAKSAANDASKSMRSLHDESKSTSTAIGKVASRLTQFGDILLQWTDVSTFENFTKGAEQATLLIEKLSKNLKSERLQLVGQLDISRTAAAIKQQITGADSVVASSIRAENAFVQLTGTLNTKATAIEIGRVLSTEMSQALSASGNKVALTSEGISVENEQTAEKSIAGFTEKFRAVKKLFEELKNNDIRSLFTEWNASFASLNIPDSTIKSLEKVSATLTQISRALKTLNTPVAKIDTTTFGNSINGQLSQAVSNTNTQIKNGTQITVSVSSQQVTEAINLAVANVDSTKISKVVVPAQITNLNEAVNEAIIQAHQTDSQMAALPIVVSVDDLGAQVSAAINQLNNTPDALPKIKLGFDGNVEDTSSLVSQAQEAAARLEQLVAQSAGKTANTGDVSKRVSDMTRAVNTAKKVLAQFEKQQNNLKTRGGDQQSQEYEQLEKQIVAAEQALKRFKKVATTGSREDALKLYDENNLGDTISQIRTLTALVKDFYKALGGGNGSDQSDSKFESKLLKWEQQLNSWQKIYDSVDKEHKDETGINSTELNKQLDSLTQIRQLRSEIVALENKPVQDSQDLKDLDDKRQRLQELIVEVEKYIVATKRSRAESVGTSKEVDKVAKAQQRLNDWVAKYEARLKRFPALWQEIQQIQAAAASGMDSVELQRQIDSVMMRARSMGVETENIFTKIWERVGFNFRSMVASQGIMLVTSSLREIYNNVKDLDTAMTELKKVTDGTASTYTKFLEDATDRAQQLGASLVDVVSASADFARLGYSIDDSAMLSDAALIYLNVGDDVDTIEDSTKALISTMQGFGIEAANVMSIVDKFNEVSNKYASSAGDIGEITLRSAAAMSAAGSSLEETIALGVAANTVQQDADTVGTAMKTMSMRLRSSKTDMEAAGEDTDGMAESVSKLRSELLALSGVDIMIDDETYKTPYQMLVEMGKIWNDLNDVTQANITELLFGKRQANIGSSILQNVELAESILETANNAEGSALRENEVYLSSIEGKLSKLSATWQTLSQDTLDTDLVKGVLDFLNGALKVIDVIVDKVGSIPMLIGTIIASLAPLKKTDELMSSYRKRNQALGCRWLSSYRGQTVKSWEQLKLAG